MPLFHATLLPLAAVHLDFSLSDANGLVEPSFAVPLVDLSRFFMIYGCLGVQRTLLELLGVVADRRGGLPISICVSSRDELDAVCAAVANLPFVSMSPLVIHDHKSTKYL